jgi:hypothetical protein
MGNGAQAQIQAPNRGAQRLMLALDLPLDDKVWPRGAPRWTVFPKPRIDQLVMPAS